ncbi:hypothetical protein EDD27_2188 [Nonomuraea polychroma]|uniref:Uncharacterized protein n=1 Tax=Nonomuraea polychroma TaxID=46176 RepID=A0A438M1Z5_9ACTN|nr:hypothetical protein [Nonomuraea polychroma]RVX39815.1 hypothetical protein EDD27_2188 [Nonomuraea polychroma]
MSPHFRDLGEALEWRAKGETLLFLRDGARLPIRKDQAWRPAT